MTISDSVPTAEIPEGFVEYNAALGHLPRVDGHSLQEGMIVLVADKARRPIGEVRADLARRDARWCRITKIHHRGNPEVVYFDCEYADGTVYKGRSYCKDVEWLVWIVEPSPDLL